MKVWLGLRQGHWNGLPRLPSPTSAAVLFFKLLVRPTYIHIRIYLFIQLIGFLNPEYLILPASTVKRFLQVRTFFGFCSSHSSWCPCEARREFETRTAGHLVQQAQIRSDGLRWQCTPTRDYHISLQRSEADNPVTGEGRNSAATHILEATGEEFLVFILLFLSGIK